MNRKQQLWGLLHNKGLSDSPYNIQTVILYWNNPGAITRDTQLQGRTHHVQYKLDAIKVLYK